MRNLKKEIENKKIEKNKLLQYGFKQNNNQFLYEDFIGNHKFKIRVMYEKNVLTSQIIDLNTQEEYSLVDISSASGNFVGFMKEEYEKKINDIIKCCSTPNVFKSEQAKKIIAYIKNNYQSDLEFLWEKKSKNAIWRHFENQKWFAALLIIEEKKLDILSDKMIEIIDLKASTDFIKQQIDYKKYFPGYHMNKNHWVTIKLDNSVEIEEIYKRIDESYRLK